MIYVECKPDFTLVKSLAKIPKREIVHELKGKGEVCTRLERQKNCKGLIDEDPGCTQPRYIRKLELENYLAQHELKVFYDKANGNRLIVLCPKLEDWILKAAKEAKLKMGNYSLPDSPEGLHRVINLDPDKFERLLSDLKDSERLKTLRELLEAHKVTKAQGRNQGY